MRWLLALGIVAAIGGNATAGGSADGSADAAPSVDDPQAWLSARGVKDPAKQLGDTCCCVEVAVGSPAEHALRCSEEESIPTEGADIAVREVIRVVRAGKVVKVLEAWTAVENLDLPRAAPPALKVQLTIDRSGRTATIGHAEGRNACDALPRLTADSTSADRAYRKSMDRVCASRGTYRWRGGRFVRTTR